MKAVIYEKYGSPDVLRIKYIEKPIPKQNEVLVKIHATTITTVDSIFRRGDQFFARMATGPIKPKNKILGTEFSGIVEAIGSEVKRFNVGEKVFGSSHTGFQTHAEYICLPEDGPFISMPAEIYFTEAASIPSGALTALPFLRDSGKIKKDQKVLIIGASGSVGSFAVQLAKYFGAEVTGVTSGKNSELVKKLGADKIIDYTIENFTEKESSYNLVFDTVGKSSYTECKKILLEDGIFLQTVIGFPILFQMFLTNLMGRKKAIINFTGLRSPKQKIDDLIFIKTLVESKKLFPLIDKKYTFDQIKDAYQYVDQGHKRGNVVLTLS